MTDTYGTSDDGHWNLDYSGSYFENSKYMQARLKKVITRRAEYYLSIETFMEVKFGFVTESTLGTTAVTTPSFIVFWYADFLPDASTATVGAVSCLTASLLFSI